MAHSQPASDLYGAPSASNVTAVLGPTNTGKTHLAIERMLGHQSGLIGLPLRLLAREVYDKIVQRVGAADVALVTGEEKIKPKNPRYWVSTVEAMPRDLDVEFVAVDEIQLAGDPERGHVFTDRLFHARGSQETLLLGAETMRDALTQLLPGVNFVSRPRLSKLTYAGPKKISRLPRRSAIVAFSVKDVYEIAEFVRRQRGGAAVVLGALSPRTRNAQVELFQSGDVDFLVATDAIGMGLNLDVAHVAFAGVHKFDGLVTRELTPPEVAQIAGRAGRHVQDGTFGVTGDVMPLSSDLINRVEAHDFDPIGALQWRARRLDFASADRLLASLKQAPNKPYLMKARESDDVMALEALVKDARVLDMAKGPANVQLLWEVCQVPDYRKIGPQDHSDLVKQLYLFLMADEGTIPADWIASQVDQHQRTDGDIDTIANRIAHIRTWTFVANRVEWLEDPAFWQGRTREIEDQLSDALHEGLTNRFVDQRTSTLMKRLNEKDELFVEVDDDGKLHVEDHFVGKISGFMFTPDSESAGLNGRAARSAAFKVLSKELAMRSKEMVDAEMADFSLSADGKVLWKEAVIGQLLKGDHILKPKVSLLADEQLNGPAKEECEAKLQAVVDALIADRLAPLVQLNKSEDLSGLARGVAYQLVENVGVLLREPIANDIRQLDQEARGQLRKFGVRFGAFNIYFPILLKPAATEISRLLWLTFHEKIDEGQAWELPRAGLTSAGYDKAIQEAYYKTSGFHVCGSRVVRVDMLERLADLIRPLISWRKDKKKPVEQKPSIDNELADKAAQDTKSDGAPQELEKPVETNKEDAPASACEEPPLGATGDGGFTILPEMMSIMGCSAEELADVLQSVGYRATKQAVKTGPADKQAPSEEGALSQDTDAQPSTEAQEEAPVVEEIIIWRPRKRSGFHKSGKGGHKARTGKAGQKDGYKKARGKGRGADKKNPKRVDHGKPYKSKAPQRLDPDSPFAKLQALKDQIEDKAG